MSAAGHTLEIAFHAVCDDNGGVVCFVVCFCCAVRLV
jgi:hypothetical protein